MNERPIGIDCPEELKQAYKTLSECREALLVLERKLYEPRMCPSCWYMMHQIIHEDELKIDERGEE